jgi:glycosyltransferase involved in cell wall biosynthesis
MEKIAILIPCYNEEATIRDVIADFKRELPESEIFVYDNNSTDRTVEFAKANGVHIRHEPRQGKGNVIKRMFREIDADLYVMVDGDSTYPVEQVHNLLDTVRNGEADMAVGSRLEHHTSESFRRFHKFGNKLIKGMINVLFRTRLKDILSGYRCFNRRFVKSIPLLSSGFEVETELTLQALDKNFAIKEIPISYKERPEGSISKIRTYSDGILIMKTIVWIFKDYKPLRCFSYVALLFALAGLLIGSIPVADYITTRKVTHPSSAVLATGLIIISLISIGTGLILDTISRLHREMYFLMVNGRSQ